MQIFRETGYSSQGKNGTAITCHDTNEMMDRLIIVLRIIQGKVAFTTYFIYKLIYLATLNAQCFKSLMGAFETRFQFRMDNMTDTLIVKGPLFFNPFRPANNMDGGLNLFACPTISLTTTVKGIVINSSPALSSSAALIG